MIKIVIRYRRNSDGDVVTIEHRVDTEKEAQRWCSVIENAINKSEDVLISYQWYYIKEGDDVIEDTTDTE